MSEEITYRRPDYENWHHEKQFERSIEQLTGYGVCCTYEQFQHYQKTTNGVACFAYPLMDPSADMEEPLLDRMGNQVWIPVIFEYQMADDELYGYLDDECPGWREYPSFTGWTENQWNRCPCCQNSPGWGELEVAAVHVWQAAFMPVEELDQLEEAIEKWAMSSNYPAWHHWWADQEYPEEDRPPARPSEPLVVEAFLPPESMREQWAFLTRELEWNYDHARRAPARDKNKPLTRDYFLPRKSKRVS